MAHHLLFNLYSLPTVDGDISLTTIQLSGRSAPIIHFQDGLASENQSFSPNLEDLTLRDELISTG